MKKEKGKEWEEYSMNGKNVSYERCGRKIGRMKKKEVGGQWKNGE